MRKGFTLVELSIVMVIIGILIGGVLKGKAMIENSKIKRLHNDIKSLTAAVYTYNDKYGYYPGDDPNGNACQGDGNGYISSADERTCAWRQLIEDGAVTGDATQTTEAAVAKPTPFGGYYRLSGAAANPVYIQNNGNYIPNKIIRGLDVKEDDGVYNAGDIRSNHDYTDSADSQFTWYIF